jgi:hypothetical protein
MIVTLDEKRRLTVPLAVAPAAPGDAFDARFDGTAPAAGSRPPGPEAVPPPRGVPVLARPYRPLDSFMYFSSSESVDRMTVASLSSAVWSVSIDFQNS